MARVRLPARNPAQKLTFFLFTSAEGKGAPLPFWGPSQSFGFSLFPLPMSGDLRSLSANTWSPLRDPHSLLTVTFWLLDSADSAREDSISLTSSSPWAITWQYRSSKVSSRPDCIFEIHLLWQSGFSRVYSNSSCSCSFVPEIIKIRLSSHKMYRNNILKSQESTTILNAYTKKKSGNILKAPRIYIYIYTFIVTAKLER